MIRAVTGRVLGCTLDIVVGLLSYALCVFCALYHLSLVRVQGRSAGSVAVEVDRVLRLTWLLFQSLARVLGELCYRFHVVNGREAVCNTIDRQPKVLLCKS